MAAVILIGLLWGVPMYLVDTRARRNGRSNRKRLLIAVLMIWWGLLIPLVIALHLAGPGEARSTRRQHTAYGSYPPHNEDDDWWHAQQDTRRSEEEEEEEEENLHHSWTQQDSWAEE